MSNIFSEYISNIKKNCPGLLFQELIMFLNGEKNRFFYTIFLMVVANEHHSVNKFSFVKIKNVTL